MQNIGLSDNAYVYFIFSGKRLAQQELYLAIIRVSIT